MAANKKAATFAEAVRDKYVVDQEFDTNLDIISCIKPRKKGNEDELPCVVDLSGMRLSFVGEVEGMGGALECIQELHVPDNEFSSWIELTKLFCKLPSLKLLDLSRNPLPQLEMVTEEDAGKSIKKGELDVDGGNDSHGVRSETNNDERDGEKQLLEHQTNVNEMKERDTLLSDASTSTMNKQQTINQTSTKSDNILPTNDETTVDASPLRCQTLSLPASLTTLVLNSTLLSILSIFTLLKNTPNVKELHIGSNDLSIFPSDHNLFPSITEVNLASNFISNWSEIEKLGQIFPNLVSLVLSGNPLSRVETSEHSQLNNLKKLVLSNSLVSDTNDLQQLNQLPQLRVLKITSVPLYKNMSEVVRRKLMVAGLTKIVNLNGSHVTQKERFEAEAFYVTFYSSEEEKPNRYEELKKKYGNNEKKEEI